ncbi:MAG TPA: methionine--tRNA ligase, partial [Ghiorsea sp.]|nr:methionine--tRNA ligase [Ghiorsea sp.]
RYFLLREVPFGADGDFSHDALKVRYNSELANDVGNLLNRSLSMLKKYRGGVLPAVTDEQSEDRALIADIEAMQREVATHLEKQAFHLALERINQVVRHGNRYVAENEPWTLAKEENNSRLDTVLYHLVEALRLIAVQLSPFMPVKSEQMLSQIMNTDVDIQALRLHDVAGWGLLKAGHECQKPSPVFPRMDA